MNTLLLFAFSLGFLLGVELGRIATKLKFALAYKS